MMTSWTNSLLSNQLDVNGTYNKVNGSTKVTKSLYYYEQR